MSIETNNQRAYVYTGPGAIRTEDGIRSNIDAGCDNSRSFIASVGWLRCQAADAHRLMLLTEYEAQKAEAAVVADVPKKKPKAKPKAKAKPKT